MKYLSTFSGVGAFEIGINRIIKNAECVAYSENNKHAEKTYLKNYPEHKGINIGNIENAVFDKDLIVNDFRVSLLPDHDLLVGGPPCQDLSIAKGKRDGLKGEKSKLFYAFLAILKIKKPKYFLMENVASMSKANRDQISKLLGVEPVKICVDRFTPQKRNRLYWFNWDFNEALLPTKGWRNNQLIAWSSSNDYHANGEHDKKRERSTRDGRANTLTTGRGCGNFSSKNYMEGCDEMGCFWKRLLTPNECEKLQGLPENWTEGVSQANRFKQIGNSVNPDTVEAILKQMPGLK